MMTVSQLLKFNEFICTWKDSLSLYHSAQREPSLPFYLNLMIYNKTRDLTLLEKLLKSRLFTSKHHFLQVSKSMGNTVMEASKIDGMALPTGFKLGGFLSSICRHYRC